MNARDPFMTIKGGLTNHVEIPTTTNGKYQFLNAQASLAPTLVNMVADNDMEVNKVADMVAMCVCVCVLPSLREAYKFKIQSNQAFRPPLPTIRSRIYSHCLLG